MANLPFNGARGKIGWYANPALGLAPANARLVVVVLEAAEADSTLRTYTDLATLIAAAGNTEWTATGYTRKEHAAADVTYTPGSTAKDVLGTDDVWAALSGAASVKLLICYDPDNTTGTDSTIVPLAFYDWAVTPNGGPVTADYDQTNGVWQSS